MQRTEVRRGCITDTDGEALSRGEKAFSDMARFRLKPEAS
jgi:hypothetical protein